MHTHAYFGQVYPHSFDCNYQSIENGTRTNHKVAIFAMCLYPSCPPVTLLTTICLDCVDRVVSRPPNPYGFVCLPVSLICTPRTLLTFLIRRVPLAHRHYHPAECLPVSSLRLLQSTDMRQRVVFMSVSLTHMQVMFNLFNLCVTSVKIITIVMITAAIDAVVINISSS